MRVLLDQPTVAPAGVVPSIAVRGCLVASGDEKPTLTRVLLDGSDVTALVRTLGTGFWLEYGASLDEGCHRLEVQAASGDGVPASRELVLFVPPYIPPPSEPLRLGVDTASSATLTARISGGKAPGALGSSESSVDASMATAATLGLRGDISPGVGVDVRTNVSGTTDVVSVGDLQSSLRLGSTVLSAGRSTVEYNQYVASGLSSRQVYSIRPAGEDPAWEVFGLRGDSGMSGGVGGSGRYDRYVYGGRYGFDLGAGRAVFAAARAFDRTDATQTQGTFAAPQASSSLGLGYTGPLRLGSAAARVTLELGSSRYDPDRTAEGDSVSGAAFNAQVTGALSDARWSLRAFDVPTDFYTIGNPFLRRGTRGWETTVGSPLGRDTDLSISVSRRSDEFLSGGFSSVAGVPASRVTNLASSLTWTPARGVWPSVSLSGAWGARHNGGEGNGRIDQLERTQALVLSKAFGQATARLGLARYDLTDATAARSSVATRQWLASLSQPLGNDYDATLAWSSSDSDLGTGAAVNSDLLTLDLDGPAFSDKLRLAIGYTWSRNRSGAAGYDTDLRELRFRLGATPRPDGTIWEQLLSSLALETRFVSQTDPLRYDGAVDSTEIWLVSTLGF